MNIVERLNFENQILEAEGMSQFRVYEGTSNYYLWGDHWTNAVYSYHLWSPLPSDFPTGRPPVYIHKPNPLWGFGSARTINSYGISHAMHTLETAQTKRFRSAIGGRIAGTAGSH